MSVKRETTTALNLEAFKQVAEDKYYEVKTNAKVRGWNGSYLQDDNGNDIVADMVISTHGDTYDIGIVDNGDGTVTVVCDEHGGYVKKKLEDIVPEYIEKELDGRFVIEETKKKNHEIQLQITR